MIGRILLTVGLSAVVVAPLYAQTASPGIDAREQRQQQRIERGVESGQLTPREAGRLEAEQAKIKADEAAMKSDGKLTREERAKLHREQDRASRHIAKEKHDRQKR